MTDIFKNKKILVVGAHPDDNDFACGGTMAKAARDGAKIMYLVATSGQRGSSDARLTQAKLGQMRQREQRNAARVLGVAEVIFLDYVDGELCVNLALKEKIVKIIRQFQPDVVFTMDPSNFYFKERGFVNHSDHRAIGEAALDAVYPLARDLLSFPEHAKLGLKPHKTADLFLHAGLAQDANFYVDIGSTIDVKIQALKKHVSQVGAKNSFSRFIMQHAAELGQRVGLEYAEAFVRLQLPK